MRIMSFVFSIVVAGLIGCVPSSSGGRDGGGTADAGNLTSDGEVVLPSARAGSLSIGVYSMYAVTTDGKVRAWGSSTSGALGPATTASTQFAPLEVSGLPRVTTVTAGASFACALASDQTVWCWGKNDAGQLGKALPPVNSQATADSATPSQVVGVAGATQVVAGDSTVCALVAGGKVMCWGEGAQGQLADGFDVLSYGMHWTGTAQAVPGLSGVKYLAASSTGFLAVTSAGGVVQWGTGSSTIEPVAGFDSGYVKVGITGGAFIGFVTCGLTGAGAVFCAGTHEERAALGRGTDTTSDARVPKQVEGLSSGATDLSMGGGHIACAVVSGSLKCWGKGNGSENLGKGEGSQYEFSSVPSQVNGARSGVTTGSHSGTVSCFIANNALNCWGNQRFVGRPFEGDVDTAEPSAVVSLP